ncbi:SorB family sulfite dehydrogenase c-type cytochrome subunit [Pseudoduganella violaceinigra]|uniref:SorB family sulfite dehydrogenase c-type cytochrome subunit n=1 Tax=Pseudoduganella violaceinigra TaxID=246602 RepID=UPI0004011922|nr:cytochrome c [Pseudoduganella violaceinigra]
MKTFAILLLLAGAAGVAEITLPDETAAYKPTLCQSHQLVLNNCLLCHLAQYAQVQPRSSPRSYWEATVKKMKKPFGAQFADEDIPAMVAYLAKVYGAEKPKP